MRGSDDRKRAQEANHALTEEQKFIQASRTARLLAIWAGQEMKLSTPDADAFTKAVLNASVNGGPEAVVSIVATRMSGTATEAQVRNQYAALNVLPV